MLIHPLEQFQIQAGMLEIVLQNEPDPPERLSFLRQAAVAHHLEQSRGVFRLRNQSLNHPILQVVLKGAIRESGEVDGHVAREVMTS